MRRNASRTLLFDIHTRRLGRRAARAARRPARGAAARSCASSARVRRGDDRRRRRADRRHRRRPAGGALRPGLPRAGPGEEHLRHRLLPADEHRRARPCASRNNLLTTVAWQRDGAHSTTRSKAACSSAAPSCSGCATGSGSSARAAEVEALARERAGQRRRLPRAGVRRPGRAALGRLRARRDLRPHARRARGAHLARAALEAIAFQSADVLDGDAEGRRHHADASCASTAARRPTTC